MFKQIHQILHVFNDAISNKRKYSFFILLFVAHIVTAQTTTGNKVTLNNGQSTTLSFPTPVERVDIEFFGLTLTGEIVYMSINGTRINLNNNNYTVTTSGQAVITSDGGIRGTSDATGQQSSTYGKVRIVPSAINTINSVGATFDASGSNFSNIAQEVLKLSGTNINQKPIATDDTFIVAEGAYDSGAGGLLYAYKLSVLGNDTDIDGNPINVTSASIINTTPNPGGNNFVTVASDGVLFNIPGDLDYHGTVEIEYRITDGNSTSAPARIQLTILPTPDSPVAVDDANAGQWATAIIGNVLSNDYDPDNENIQVQNFSQPANGTVFFSGGVYTYRSKVGFTGNDFFTYTITDNTGSGTATATVNITVTTNTSCTTANNTTNTSTICESSTKTLSASPSGGFWNVISGGGFVSGNTYTPANINSNRNVIVRYTIPTSNTCPETSTDVSFTVTPFIGVAFNTTSSATINEDQTKSLSGSPSGGTWSMVSGGGTISGNTYFPANINNNTNVTLRYTLAANGSCPSSTADVSFVVTPINCSIASNTTNTSTINENQTKILTGSPSGGTWSVVSGGGFISGNTYTPANISNNSNVILRYMIAANGSCPVSTSDRSFTVIAINCPSANNTTSTATINENQTKALFGSPSGGFWSVISGGGFISGNTYTPANISNNTNVILRYTISASSFCSASTSDRSFVVTAINCSTANNTTSTATINESQTKILTASPFGGTWNVVSGGGFISGNTYTPANISSNTNVTLRYTIPANSSCLSSSANVSFIVTPSSGNCSTASNTTSTATINENQTKALSGSPSGGTWSVISGGGFVSGTTYTPANISSNTNVTLRYTIPATSSCLSSSANVSFTVTPSSGNCSTASNTTSAVTIDENQTKILFGSPVGGTWSVVSGGGFISGATYTPANINNNTNVTLRYTIPANSSCPSSSANVSFMVTNIIDADGDGDPASTDPDDNDPCIYSANQIVANASAAWAALDCNTNNSNYCVSKGSNANFEHIKQVIFGEIDNLSDNDGGYGDYTNMVITASPDLTIPIVLVPGFSDREFEEDWTVWIDYNQDGDFEEEGEMVFNAKSKITQNALITIPSDAKIGMTGVRIAMQWNNSTSTCSTFPYGEVEDYSMIIGGCQENIALACDDGDDCTTNDQYDTNCNCVGTLQDSDGDGLCDIEDPCPNDFSNNCGNSLTYCPLISEGGSDFEHIQQVNFGSIDNISNNDGGYADYTNMVADVTRGTTAPITLTPGFVGTPYDESWTVWIDYNQDGDFEDTDELVWEIRSKTSETGTIMIPNTAKIGTTRMRIAMQWNNKAPTACGEVDYGEVEDYSINIQSGSSLSVLNSSARQSATVSLYPNPVQDILTIQSGQFSVVDKIEIYNNLGHLIYEQTVEKNATQINYATSALPAGLYHVLVLVKGEQSPISKRFVKQ